MGVLHRYAGARHSDQLTVSAARGGRVRIAASGTLGLGEARRVEDAFNHELDEGAAAVLVDLRAVILADSCVVHTLVRMVDQGHSVTLEFRLSAAVQRLLEASGVSHHVIAEPGGPSLHRPQRRRRSRRPQLR
ncbi:MAG TPA: STAS domain-containing protein [Solirubrobacteraceae bacterium]|nr:STAS domain-containing protein [Solirubrobacteraceae bacterium]